MYSIAKCFFSSKLSIEVWSVFYKFCRILGLSSSRAERLQASRAGAGHQLHYRPSGQVDRTSSGSFYIIILFIRCCCKYLISFDHQNRRKRPSSLDWARSRPCLPNMPAPFRRTTTTTTTTTTKTTTNSLSFSFLILLCSSSISVSTTTKTPTYRYTRNNPLYSY